MPVDLSKLSDVVKNYVVKKDVYDAKIKNIEIKIPFITNLANNTARNAEINEVKNEIPSITNLATNVFLNANRNEVRKEIPTITKLATATALTDAENKVPNVNNLFKKADYNEEINYIRNKYFTRSDHNMFSKR